MCNFLKKTTEVLNLKRKQFWPNQTKEIDPRWANNNLETEVTWTEVFSDVKMISQNLYRPDLIPQSSKQMFVPLGWTINKNEKNKLMLLEGIYRYIVIL